MLKKKIVLHKIFKQEFHIKVLLMLIWIKIILLINIFHFSKFIKKNFMKFLHLFYSCYNIISRVTPYKPVRVYTHLLLKLYWKQWLDWRITPWDKAPVAKTVIHAFIIAFGLCRLGHRILCVRVTKQIE